MSKNIVKYVFTQNIDGLELKANIPSEKIIFAHGTFTQGHCPQCKIPVDINKINKGIEEGYVVRCDICGGPCKPNVVFYGEDLNEDFYKKIEESASFDLVLIMGTSLQVYPFAEIPRLMKTSSWKVVFNRDKVGRFLYSFLFSNTLFIQGTTDESIKIFLKDVDLLDDFKNFVKINYGDDNIDNNESIKMLEVNKMDVENKQDINDIKSSEEIQKDNNNENNNKKEMNDN
jgi:NAD-dependent SIR2 family protein deacetylase